MGIFSDALRRRLLAALATSSVVAIGCGGRETETPTSSSSGSSGAASSSSSGATASSSGSSGSSGTATCRGQIQRQCTNNGAVRKGSFSQIPPDPDAAPPPPPPPPVLDPTTGCAVAEEMMDGCCNGAVAGPFLENGTCCWDFCAGACCGRPVRVDGIAVVAEATSRRDWTDEAASFELTSLDERTRAALIADYTRDALTEHASIASFSLFALELLAVGAPPDLVAGAHAAALDEIAHARTTFAIASAIAGTDLGPTALPARSMTPKTDLAAIAVDCVRDGCIGETVASLVAAEQARRATVPSIREALTRIAEDEARHAELAFRFVRWALAKGDARVAEAVARAFADFGAPIGRAIAGEIDRPAWEAHGRLSEADFAAVADAAIREVIRPCVAELFLAQTPKNAGDRGLNSTASTAVLHPDGDDPDRGARRTSEA